MRGFGQFLSAAGKKGVSFMTGGLLSFSIAGYEHFRGSSLTALGFGVAGVSALLAGAYFAWSDEHQKWEAEYSKNQKPQITGEIVRVYYAGCYVFVKLRLTNKNDVDTTIKHATLSFVRDGKKYDTRDIILVGMLTPREATDLDRIGDFYKEKIVHLLDAVTYEKPVRYRMASEGWLQVEVIGLDITESTAVADITVTLTDDFGEAHKIEGKSVFMRQQNSIVWGPPKWPPPE